jgi:predicted site-specific integrase-resolvase
MPRFISIRKAAERARVSQTTLRRAIKLGKLSRVYLPNGHMGVNPVEVKQLFPPKQAEKDEGRNAPRRDADAKISV